MFYFTNQAVISSTTTATNVTSCLGACCIAGTCSLTTPQNCDSESFNGFVPCSNATCPMTSTVLPLVGCTINYGNGTCATQWGYNNLNNFTVSIPYGSDNNFTQQGVQGTIFYPGIHLNNFTSYGLCSSILTWFIEYEGYNSSVSNTNMTTCTGACCNITLCASTTDNTCSLYPNTTFKGYFTNCTSGINGTSPCGIPTPINPIVNCTINYGNTTCSTIFGYNNTNTVPITIPIGSDNFFTPITNEGQTTIFQSGLNLNQFIVYWNCLLGSIQWTIIINQTIINF